jgi:outer membrane biosynthesis protein TonB
MYSSGHLLRASYVWYDEVMADKVLVEPEPITIGPSPGTTFATPPDLGLPASYAVLRPGRAGYVLTVSAKMSGKISLQGREMSVAEFVAGGGGTGTGGQSGSFRATAVGPGDWGVIRLDEHGNHTLFFQFVKADPPIPRSTWRDSELLLPAVAFSVFLHAAFLIYALWYFQERGDGFTFPGNRELVAGYIVNRPEQAPPEEPDAVQDGTPDGDEDPSSTKGDEGKSGGEGEKERKRAPDPDKGEPDEPLPKSIQTALLSKSSRDRLERMARRGGIDERLGKATARLQGRANDGSMAGFGPGSGTGVGEDHGTGTTRKGKFGGRGGGGQGSHDAVTTKTFPKGKGRGAKGLPGGTGHKMTGVVKPGRPGGKLGGLTHEQILRVVRAHKNAIRTCYDRELQRTKGLGGKIVIRWKIDAGGVVSGAKVRSSSMRNGRVEDCIVRRIARMKFPKPKGGVTAVVNFPFIFAQR